MGETITKPIILIVDDDPSVRMYVSKTLASRHYATVFAVENGGDARDILNSVIPDMVISDVRMPIMNGIKLIHSARDSGIRIPLVLMTSSPCDVDEVTAGMLSGLLEKPFSFEALIDMVDRILYPHL